MSPSAAPVRRLALAVSFLLILAPGTARAQASGVLQATVRVLKTHRPAERAVLEHGSVLVSPGDSVVVDSPAARARVQLVALPDTQEARAGRARPRTIRATVTYLR